MKNLLNKKAIPDSADYTVVALAETGAVKVKSSTPAQTQTQE